MKDDNDRLAEIFRSALAAIHERLTSLEGDDSGEVREHILEDVLTAVVRDSRRSPGEIVAKDELPGLLHAEAKFTMTMQAEVVSVLPFLLDFLGFPASHMAIGRRTRHNITFGSLNLVTMFLPGQISHHACSATVSSMRESS
ncbi:hypothetical protein R3X27_24325 [Tropicimonas sp. TH_r6]|uniref:hypothetical protein n=1 Tax=Tropicimonas sp. TH_r6 TaxID=3082085 RepID=UPI002953FC58|nr:hypothetical protein [Tropicimonas sp. TH_r6]MDV7145817.1 hypothetical protein [Tropicimonas sp. TH_r6]